MKKFRVLIRGENFYLESEGVTQRFGFYTTRYVEAADEKEAERWAIELLRKEERLRANVRNDRTDPPMLFAEETAEIASFESVENREPGLAFYEDRAATN